MIGCKMFLSTSREKDKFPPIQLEAGQILTAAASTYRHQTMYLWLNRSLGN